ncbi:HNH endonuclease [Cellulosimicrobium sp. Marseille-Q4280]|uniref:HNH endonuclease n=1 Tax=Cellulosimicrobium sp. Marseille-Q4280 TaxID=2937992 RepID=UPI00203D2245|nr:HNH endonuclease [Cellulosimicrobium sp. Marseille-Q4280]
MPASTADYLDLTTAKAAQQWRAILERSWPSGRNQVDYLPIETLLCLAGMFVVEHSRYGSGSAHRAPEPVQSLAQLFKRRPTSIIAKMNNLHGSRSHGARNDLIVGSVLRTNLQAMSHIYRVILGAARTVGVDRDSLPDFLGLETGGEVELLGQDELDVAALESVVEREIHRWVVKDVEEQVTERLMLASLRIGQHRFARSVLTSWAYECAFCGFSLGVESGPTLLRASHIKPWRNSDGRERLDVANGYAACAAHDSAFDAGLLTVTDELEVLVSHRLDRAIANNAAVRTYFAEPHLKKRLHEPVQGLHPRAKYLGWHRSHVFEAGPPEPVRSNMPRRAEA